MNGFYYGNPQNRFWAVLAEVLSDELPVNSRKSRNFFISTT
jgi:G:T/U-mismatch repair DNA glycosylase